MNEGIPPREPSPRTQHTSSTATSSTATTPTISLSSRQPPPPPPLSPPHHRLHRHGGPACPLRIASPHLPSSPRISPYLPISRTGRAMDATSPLASPDTPPTRHAHAHIPDTRPPTQPAAVPRTRPRPSPAGAEAGVRPSPAKGTRARAKGRRARREEAKGQAAARREGAVWSERRVAADEHARRAVETSRAGAAGAADAVALAPRPLEGPPLLSARAAR